MLLVQCNNFTTDEKGNEADCFSLGFQFPFQREKMQELADGNVISMDATFGTTRLGVSNSGQALVA